MQVDPITMITLIKQINAEIDRGLISETVKALGPSWLIMFSSSRQVWSPIRYIPKDETLKLAPNHKLVPVKWLREATGCTLNKGAEEIIKGAIATDYVKNLNVAGKDLGWDQIMKHNIRGREIVNRR